MQISDVFEFVATLDREQAHQVGDAVRARLKAIRDADPYLYIIERVHQVEAHAYVPAQKYVTYSTWSQGQVCFFTEHVDDYGGIALGNERSKDGGSGLAFWTTRGRAQEYLDSINARLGHSSMRTLRIREIDKATGKLCEFEEQLITATEGVST